MTSPYTTEEAARYRQMFAPVAERYRRDGRIFVAGVFAYIFCIIAALLTDIESSLRWLIIGAVYVIAVVFVLRLAFVRQQVLACPACHGALKRNLGDHCPQCGGGPLQPGKWFRARRCSACGASVRRSKRGQILGVRACTHCGLMLDDRGL